jgi:hypothetical protein
VVLRAAAIGSSSYPAAHWTAEGLLSKPAVPNLSYSYPAFLHELLDIQINLNIQQDFEIVHSYYPAGYLYPAVHRTAAHWTATSALLQHCKQCWIRAAANGSRI